MTRPTLIIHFRKNHPMKEILYNNMETVLKRMGCKYEFVPPSEKQRRSILPDQIRLTWHTTGKQKNVWHIKGFHLKGYVYIDQCGYAGWSEIAHNKEIFKQSQLVDLEEATIFFNQLAKEYIGNNTSHVEQPECQGIEHLDINSPYVFFAGQIIQDSVIKTHAKIPPQQHADLIVKHLQSKGYTVVFKQHPAISEYTNNTVSGVQITDPNVIHYSGSIHDIIPDAAAVVVMNSGVGFEALLHKKHVFASGFSDYHWVAHNMFSKKNIQAIPNIMKQKVDEEKIIKFVYYILNHVLVDINDLDSIERKMQQVIRSYQE